MSVSHGLYLKNHYLATQQMGYREISSDFQLEIKGYEETSIWMCKQAPDPQIVPGGEIEIPMPLGATRFQPAQVKVAQQGAVALTETMRGHVSSMLLSIIADGGTFDCSLYAGTTKDYLWRKDMWDCFLQLDNPDRNWDNRTEVVTLSGTLFFHYFGEKFEGNSKDYRAGGKSSRAVGNGGATPASSYQPPSALVMPAHPNQYIAQ